MKLGIVADEIDRDFGKAVTIGKSLGLLRYEVRFLTSGRAPVCDANELAGVERIVAAEGVEITALSPGLFKMTDTESAFDKEMAEVYPKAAELAQRWKLPGLIVFGFRKPGATEENAHSKKAAAAPPQIVDWLRRANEAATRDGLVLMIEPEPICWADSATAAVALIERSGAHSLRINYDPGNVAWFEGRDPLDEFEAASKWIANVHVKDLLPLAKGAARPTFVPAGEGMIDYAGHFRALKASGYEGPISLEPHMDGHPDTIRKCIEAVSKHYGSDAA